MPNAVARSAAATACRVVLMCPLPSWAGRAAAAGRVGSLQRKQTATTGVGEGGF